MNRWTRNKNNTIQRKALFSRPTSTLLALIALVLVLFTGLHVYAAVVSPTTPPTRGYAQVGDAIGPITVDGTTTPFRLKGKDGDHRVAMQVQGTWDGAAVTGQMRICEFIDTADSAIACEWITMPVTTWPITVSSVIGNIQAYGPATEFRLSVASAGGSTSLYFIMRQ